MSPAGPPPLSPFGLVLHRDGRWTHEGFPILNGRLREAFDRGVCFLPGEGREGKYVVRLGRYRAEIELEETGFFVRGFEAGSGEISLSDRSCERLRVESLRLSPHDGALVCDIKHDLAVDGLPARFTHSAQADLLGAAEERDGEFGIRVAGVFETLPPLDPDSSGGSNGEAAPR